MGNSLSPKSIFNRSAKVNVRARRAKFEENILGKYQTQCNVKEMSKEKSKLRKEKIKKQPSPEVKSDPMTELLKEIRNDLKDIKGELRTNNNKIEEMNQRIGTLDRNEIEAEKKFEVIKRELKESHSPIKS